MLASLLTGLFIRLQRTSGIRDMRVARRRFWKKDSTLCFIRIISSSIGKPEVLLSSAGRWSRTNARSEPHSTAD